MHSAKAAMKIAAKVRPDFKCPLFSSEMGQGCSHISHDRIDLVDHILRFHSEDEVKRRIP